VVDELKAKQKTTMKLTNILLTVIVLAIAFAIGLMLSGESPDKEVIREVVIKEIVSESFGAFQASIVRQGSTTPEWFGSPTSVRTPTTTLLTIDQVHQFSRIGLGITVFASTSIGNAGTIYIQPQVSIDAGDQNATSTEDVWYDWTPSVKGVGTAINNIFLPVASSSVLTLSPDTLGTTTKLFVFENIVGKFMRFRVWTTGTSTVLLDGFKQY